MSLFVDVYVLQTVPPSNLNRDDTGSPKSAFYGGTRRARASSQSWKRATRTEFANRLDAADLGVRTMRVAELIVEQMRQQQPDLDVSAAIARIDQIFAALGLKAKAPKAAKAGKAKLGEEAAPAGPAYPETNYLIFFSRHQIRALAALARSEEKITKKNAEEAADRNHGIEVALFGRMVADNKDLTVDASVQVAHAISTHAVEDESDYFTAVDDARYGDEPGAGMLGTVEFNSATLYRYATVNIAGLLHNLGDPQATVRATEAFVRDFARSMPTGKQNTFANRTTPDAVVVAVRHDQPVNLVGAFEEAITSHGSEGRVRLSAEALAQEMRNVENFVQSPVAVLVAHAGRRTEVLEQLGQATGLDELVSTLGGVLTEQLATAQSAATSS